MTRYSSNHLPSKCNLSPYAPMLFLVSIVQRKTPCITLVICPLVALMEDQVKGLSRIVKGKDHTLG